jgi:hypothetical protein
MQQPKPPRLDWGYVIHLSLKGSAESRNKIPFREGDKQRKIIERSDVPLWINAWPFREYGSETGCVLSTTKTTAGVFIEWRWKEGYHKYIQYVWRAP